ncbi:hypothetical protein NC652_012239 [Populus alba x Populus x berolinensis]|nr:hypothetical protein NC652_012239 [Populus alba x Populus x berolinensis]
MALHSFQAFERFYCSPFCFHIAYQLSYWNIQGSHGEFCGRHKSEFRYSIHWKSSIHQAQRICSRSYAWSRRFSEKSSCDSHMGLAYVDFVDDEHLAAAITKNKQLLFGKRLSIARSDPKQNRRDGRRVPREQAFASDRRRHNWESASKEHVDTHNASGSQEASQTATLKSDDNIQFKGKNIFAVPRNVRTLGLSANKLKTVEEGDEKPKSNDEFRKIVEALGILQNCLAKLKHKRRPPM